MTLCNSLILKICSSLIIINNNNLTAKNLYWFLKVWVTQKAREYSSSSGFTYNTIHTFPRRHLWKIVGLQWLKNINKVELCQYEDRTMMHTPCEDIDELARSPWGYILTPVQEYQLYHDTCAKNQLYHDTCARKSAISWYLCKNISYIMIPVQEYQLYPDTCARISAISWHLCKKSAISWHLCKKNRQNNYTCARISAISWHLCKNISYIMIPVQENQLYSDTCARKSAIFWHQCKKIFVIWHMTDINGTVLSNLACCYFVWHHRERKGGSLYSLHYEANGGVWGWGWLSLLGGYLLVVWGLQGGFPVGHTNCCRACWGFNREYH